MKLIKRNLLGLPIYDTTMKDLVSTLDLKLKNNHKAVVFGLSAGAYGRLKQRPDLVGLYNKMDIIIADGQGIPILGKYFGVPISEHVGIVNLTHEMLKLANEKGYRLLLFGGTQEVNDKANKNISVKYPNIKLCEGINGYFDKNDEMTIVRKINKEMPDILFIGISYPIKEQFSIKYRNILYAKIIIPCGGALDVIAGHVKRPPFTLKQFPITWFYRFIQEPRRLFKATVVTVLYSMAYVFPLLYVKHILGIEKNPSIIKFFKLDEKT